MSLKLNDHMLKYRSEIDGMRALAVLPVILFHAGFGFFSGGFVGVDIFFVISGYLITTILIDDIENKRFNIFDFYERRARRILPALFFVMAACIPFAWFWMLPDPLENFGQSLVATTLFANNILLYITTDYWDLSSEFKPLLHSWSLAVEEQYYVIFPLFLLLVWRFGKDKVFWLIVILALISLASSEWGWRHDPQANFYLAHTRAWEILSGSIAAFIIQKRGVQANNPLSLLGLGSIIFAIIYYDETTPFPSVYTLLPVLGAILLILYARKDTLAAKLLSMKMLVAIGLISYSAYLWHQPLFAFMRIYSLSEPSHLTNLIIVVATFILAFMSWKWIEQPFRNKKIISTKVLISMLSISAAFLVTFGYAAHKTHGFIGRVFDDQVASSDMYISYNERNFAYKSDDYADNDNVRILVVGDSFGRDIVNVIRETYDMDNVNLIYRDDFDDCSLNQSQLGQNLFNKADLILFASQYSVGENSCVQLLIQKADIQKKMLFFIGTKQFGYNLNWITRTEIGQRNFLTNKGADEAIIADQETAAFIPSKNYLSIMDKLVNQNGVLVTDGQGRLLSADRTHLTKFGAIYVGDNLFIDSDISKLLEVNE